MMVMMGQHAKRIALDNKQQPLGLNPHSTHPNPNTHRRALSDRLADPRPVPSNRCVCLIERGLVVERRVRGGRTAKIPPSEPTPLATPTHPNPSPNQTPHPPQRHRETMASPFSFSSCRLRAAGLVLLALLVAAATGFLLPSPPSSPSGSSRAARIADARGRWQQGQVADSRFAVRTHTARAGVVGRLGWLWGPAARMDCMCSR